MAQPTEAVAEYNESNPIWVPPRTYARHYSLAESTVRGWIRDKRIRSLKMGKAVRVDLNSIPS